MCKSMQSKIVNSDTLYLRTNFKLQMLYNPNPDYNIDRNINRLRKTSTNIWIDLLMY